LMIIESDAMDFIVHAATHGIIDALQVDLYDATARGRCSTAPSSTRPAMTAWRPGA
jgi:predicted outer membrane lipoprotein